MLKVKGTEIFVPNMTYEANYPLQKFGVKILSA